MLYSQIKSAKYVQARPHFQGERALFYDGMAYFGIITEKKQTK